MHAIVKYAAVAGSACVMTGASVAIGMEAADPVVETKTVERVPKACLDALDAGDALYEDYQHFAKITMELPDLVTQVVESNSTSDIEAGVSGMFDVADRLGDINRRLNRSTAKVDADRAAFGGSSSECRSIDTYGYSPY